MHRPTTMNVQGGLAKYEGSPVLDGDKGIVFGISMMLNAEGTYLMYCSWWDKKVLSH
jgi:hypothetical protein